ncbi:Ig-like domain-containing protein [Clostridium hydrogenum]|uniref:Ig-like domain-containing protein n=1 Tax=Clostridium hydrogenum TaxID=2855764 RepID=UPI002E346488|nr:Ig-like domain-containing protein [Clostridium hydrogenum]
MNKKLISIVTMATVTLTSVSPVFAKNFDSKQNVALNHAWTVTFNKPVNTNEAFENVYIKNSKGNEIPTRLDFNSDNTKMIVTPTDGYAPNSTYTLVVADIIDTNDDKLSDNATMQFTTVNGAQQGSFDINKVCANGSADNVSSNVETNATFDLEVNKYIDTSTLSNITVTDKDGNKVNVNVTAIGKVIDIDPNNAFCDDTHTIGVNRNPYKCNTTYTINLKGLKSTDEQDIGTKSYSFTTRDYKLNPTIQGICDDDYIQFANQYSSDMFHPVDPATGGVKRALWPAHDNNGTIVFDKDSTFGTPYQVSSDWNEYANLQARNQYDLEVQFRKQYDQIKAKDSSYSGKMVDMSNWANIVNDASFGICDNANASMPSSIITTDIYSSYSLSSKSLDNVDLYSKNPGDMKNILRSDAHPQIYMTLPQCTGTELSLQKFYLYQELVSVFGYDYAGEISDYMYKEAYGLASERNIMQKIQIGDVTVWAEDGQFLFKY